MAYPTHEEELMMLALSSGERYGVQIQKAIEGASKGQEKVPKTHLYIGLDKLEKDGLVLSRVEGKGLSARRWYSLTDAGRKALRDLQTFRSSLARWQPSPDDKDGLIGGILEPWVAM